MRKPRRLASCSVFALLLGIVTIARGEPAALDDAESTDEVQPAAARAFWNAKQAYDAGNFAEARDQFQRAYQLTKHPDLLYDLGQAYRRMGECASARQAYEQFLRLAPSSPLAPRATKHLGSLAASCPLALAKEDRSPTTSDSAHQRPSPRPARLAPIRTAPPEARDHRRWQAWSTVTLATGLAAGAAALGLEIYNHQRYHEWRERNRSLARGTAAGGTATDWAVRQQANDRLGGSISAVDRSALLVGIGGAVLVAASAVLYVVTPSFTAPASTARARARSGLELRPSSLGPRSAGVSLSGSF